MHSALTPRRAAKPLQRLATGAFLCSLLLALQGCAVVAVTSAAVSITAGAVGLAADAAIGTAKIVGKGVGKAADAMMDDDKPDTSGIEVHYRDPAVTSSAAEPPAATSTPVEPASALPQNY